MSKKLMNWMLMATMVVGLAMSVTSCKDDDDDKTSEQRRDDADALDTDEARTAFRWLCVLADATTLDDNWQKKTYEPTIGQASENNQFTRIVIVSDQDEAKEEFSVLADMDVSLLSEKQTVNGGAAGTMTWEPSKAEAENLAVVEVNSKIMPHLQKLVYCTQEQVGSNGVLWDSMKGVAYYRLGDVIRDNDGYYWVCVRPSFAPDKGDSHWINIINAAENGKADQFGNVQPFPQTNLYTKYDQVQKYNNQTIVLPTKLSYDRKHIYNLSNLIWALLNPEAYKDACLSNKSIGLGGFDYKYHGEKFLKAVASYWDKDTDTSRNIWEILFNRSHKQMQEMRELRFYYQGYSWAWGNSGNLWRYASTAYQPKYSGSESKDKVAVNYVENGFDIRRYAGDADAKNVGEPQFDEANHTGTWVIRYKTGDELRTLGKYSPYESLTGVFNDVYVYNNQKQVQVGEKAKQETEETFQKSRPIDNPMVGNILGNDGLFYENVSDAYGADATPVAVVVCLYNPKDAIELEVGGNWTVLAMGLKDLGPHEWATENSIKYDPCGTSVSDADMFLDYLNGYSITEQLAFGCRANHNHPAARACRQYEPSGLTEEVRREHNLSYWFLPSAGQWIKALREIGLQWDKQMSVFREFNPGDNYSDVVSFFKLNNLEESAPTGKYWTATECEAENAYYITFEQEKAVGVSEFMGEDMEKTKKYLVRPFIAF